MSTKTQPVASEATNEELNEFLDSPETTATPENPKKKKNNVAYDYEDLNPGTESKLIPQELEKEQEREKKRQESIETGKSFLKGLDIFNKKVEDIKAHDEHGEHD